MRNMTTPAASVTIPARDAAAWAGPITMRKTNVTDGWAKSHYNKPDVMDGRAQSDYKKVKADPITLQKANVTDGRAQSHYKKLM